LEDVIVGRLNPPGFVVGTVLTKGSGDGARPAGKWRWLDARPARVSGVEARGPGLRGPTAMAALAVGTAALGAVAIGRLVIGRAAIKRLEIGELEVGHLRVRDLEVMSERRRHRGPEGDAIEPASEPPTGP